MQIMKQCQEKLGISWMTVGLLGAVGVGLTGIAFIPDNHIKMDDPDYKSLQLMNLMLLIVVMR
jgi:transcriptional regulator of aromatic amino acid metabolism